MKRFLASLLFFWLSAAAREQRLRDGIPMPSALLDNIRAICERSGIAFLL